MKSVLLYDGECGFCSRVVSVIMRHERQQTLYFAALQSPVASTLLLKAPHSRQLDSVLWVDVDSDLAAQRILSRSEAGLQVCSYLGGWWQALRIARLIPRPWRDQLYDIVARNRHRLLRSVACELPTASNRQRFLNAADDVSLLHS